VLRAFRSRAGQAWLEARYLRVSWREERLELFPEVEDSSLGSPVIAKDGVVGVVTGPSDAAPAGMIAG
jgi:hypothetical protein